ncbi:MAG: hypothetical protein ACPL4C_00910 [Brevinematia bacterium]
MKHLTYFVLIPSSFIVLFSCAPSKNSETIKNTSPSTYENNVVSYEVEGEGEDYFDARKNAIINGIKKAIIELIGNKKFDKYKQVIEGKILNAKKIVNEISEFNSTAIFDRNDKKVVRAIVKVKKDILKKYIEEIDFSKEEMQDTQESTISQKTTYEYKTSSDNTGAENQKFEVSKDSPLTSISFLVFVPNDKLTSLEEDEDYKLFLEMLNSKISEYGLDYIDFKRAIELSKKFYAIYEEKSGEATSLAQMLAQELKADVYIEATLDIIPSIISGNYVELVAKGSIKAYDSSTGKGLGIITFSEAEKSSKGLSRSKLEVMEKIISFHTPKLLKNVEDYFSKGTKISVKIIGFKTISDEKSLSSILDSLPGIVDKKRKSISGNISEYEITYKGGSTSFVEDLIDILSNDPKYSRSSIDQSGNSVIINVR